MPTPDSTPDPRPPAPDPDRDLLMVATHRPGIQVVPRPPTAVAGAPAPWAHLSAEERRAVPLQRVVAAVEGGAPTVEGLHGADARLGAYLAANLVERRAATLVALFEEPAAAVEGARVLLTVRATSLRSHRGEVAFPGGRLEPAETVEAAALREAFEEVGLDPVLPTVVGRLGSLPTVSSNTLMTPVVATLPGRPVLARGPGEVDRVFDVPLGDLLVEGNFREEWWSFPGRPGMDGLPGSPFPVWFYEAGGELVWGATARVLTELLCRALGLPLPTREPPGGPATAVPER